MKDRGEFKLTKLTNFLAEADRPRAARLEGRIADVANTVADDIFDILETKKISPREIRDVRQVLIEMEPLFNNPNNFWQFITERFNNFRKKENNNGQESPDIPASETNEMAGIRQRIGKLFEQIVQELSGQQEHELIRFIQERTSVTKQKFEAAIIALPASQAAELKDQSAIVRKDTNTMLDQLLSERKAAVQKLIDEFRNALTAAVQLCINGIVKNELAADWQDILDAKKKIKGLPRRIVGALASWATFATLMLYMAETKGPPIETFALAAFAFMASYNGFKELSSSDNEIFTAQGLSAALVDKIGERLSAMELPAKPEPKLLPSAPEVTKFVPPSHH